MKIINQGCAKKNRKLKHKKTSTCDCYAGKGIRLCLHLKMGDLTGAKDRMVSGGQSTPKPDQQFTNPGHSTPPTCSG